MNPSEPPNEDPRLGELLRQARSVRAPDALRARVEAQAQRASRPAPRRRAVFGAGLAGALAAAAVVVALLLPGGPGAPTVAQAAALALRGAQSGPPPADPTAPGVRLAESVGEVYFPSWTASLGWRATGTRTDRLGGRRTVTVFYRRGGAKIAYTIVGLPALGEPAAPSVRLSGVAVRTLRLGSRTVVTWRRGGQTCVISTRSVPLGDLRKLAAWRDAASLS
ncbi:MAG TPA: hypothetical protein VLP43_11065 [Solirubrobacteraceae bacterium]|nr:hypothetical protein [Solirubrobacteraceae bacterium]